MKTAHQARIVVAQAIAAIKATTNSAGFANSPVPHGCEQEALKALKAGEFYLAAEWYHRASGYSIGHRRSERYETCARRALEQVTLWPMKLFNVKRRIRAARVLRAWELYLRTGCGYNGYFLRAAGELGLGENEALAFVKTARMDQEVTVEAFHALPGQRRATAPDTPIRELWKHAHAWARQRAIVQHSEERPTKEMADLLEQL